jgi:hypothetical protein
MGQIGRVFFQKLIKVIPLSTNNIAATCGICDITNIATACSPGIPNSDVHIYLDWDNNSGITEKFRSRMCAMAPGNKGPRFATITFNEFPTSWWSHNPTADNLFIYYMEETMRQFIKIFGFAFTYHQYWYSSITGTFYTASDLYVMGTVRGVSTYFL